jgi:transcriptional regulator with XRE-family HTH domain
MSNLGKKILEMLKIRDMTISELSRESTISKGALSEMVSGKRATITTTLQKLAKALRIHPAFFLEDDTVGPGELLENIVDEEDRRFILSEEGALWIKLTREAAESGISIDKMKAIMELLKKD